MAWLWRSKINHKAKYYIDCYCSHLSRPFNKEVIITIFSIPILLVILGHFFGSDMMNSELSVILSGGLAFMGAYICYAIIGIFTSFIEANKHEKEVGFWAGDTYTYNQHVLLKTVVVTPKDNGQGVAIKINDSERKAMVHFRIEIEDAAKRVYACIGTKNNRTSELQDKDIPYGNSPVNMGLMLDKTKTVYLYTMLMEYTVPVTIRVYMKSWKAQL